MAATSPAATARPARPSAASFEEESQAAKTRVITGVSTLTRGSAPAKTLAKAWIAFVDAAQNGSQQAAEDGYTRFLAALSDMELMGRKLGASQAASRRELEGFELKHSQLGAAIEQAKAAIEAKKAELAAARQWRQQQEEYEALRKAIMQVPPQAQSQAQLEAVQRQIAHIQADTQRHAAQFEASCKRAAALRLMLDDLLAALPAPGGAVSGEAGAGDAMQVDG